MFQLFSKTEKEYGEKYYDHLFEQYKLYIDSAEKTSDRRQQTNNYFIAINAALISLIGVFFQIKGFQEIYWFKAIFSLFGIIICIIFWYLIRSYKQLNSGKFAVLHEIEKGLPLALYDYEWKMLGEGKDKNKYYPFSHIELFMPWVFGIIYLLLGFFFFFQ